MEAYLVSAIIFIGTFIFILMNKPHRTIVALIGASLMVAVGMSMGFYSQEAALASVDFNTLGLLLGMIWTLSPPDPLFRIQVLLQIAGKYLKNMLSSMNCRIKW